MSTWHPRTVRIAPGVSPGPGWRSTVLSVLEGASLMVFIPVSDLGRARSFYVDVLGLSAKEETPFALVLDACGTAVRLTQVNDLRPQPFTIAGWQVPDIGSAIEILVSRGVTFIHYDGMEQDANGVWTLP